MFIEKTFIIFILFLMVSLSAVGASGEMICEWEVVKKVSDTRSITRPVCKCGEKFKFNSLGITKIKKGELQKYCGEKFIIKEKYEPVARNGRKMIRQKLSVVDSNLQRMLISISSVKNFELLKYFLNSQNYNMALLHWLLKMNNQRKFEETYNYVKKLNIDKKYLKIHREVLPTYWPITNRSSKEERVKLTKKLFSEQIAIYQKLGFNFNTPIDLSYHEEFREHQKNFADTVGNTILHEAMFKTKDKDLFELYFNELKNYGLNYNMKNDLGETALHHAAIFGRVDLIDFLISSGVSLNSADNSGFTPLDVSVQYGNFDFYLKLKKVGGVFGKNKKKFIPKWSILPYRTTEFIPRKITKLKEIRSEESFKDLNEFYKFYIKFMDINYEFRKLSIKTGKVRDYKMLERVYDEGKVFLSNYRNKIEATKNIKEFMLGNFPNNDFELVGVSKGNLYTLRFYVELNKFIEKLVFEDENCNRKRRDNCISKIITWDNYYIGYSNEHLSLFDRSFNEVKKYIPNDFIKEVKSSGQNLIVITDKKIITLEKDLSVIDSLTLYEKNGFLFSAKIFFEDNIFAYGSKCEQRIMSFPPIGPECDYILKVFSINSKGKISGFVSKNAYHSEFDFNWVDKTRLNTLRENSNCQFFRCDDEKKWFATESRDRNGKLYNLIELNNLKSLDYMIVKHLYNDWFLLKNEESEFLGRVKLVFGKISFKDVFNVSTEDFRINNTARNSSNNFLIIGENLIILENYKMLAVDLKNKKELFFHNKYDLSGYTNSFFDNSYTHIIKNTSLNNKFDKLSDIDNKKDSLSNKIEEKLLLFGSYFWEITSILFLLILGICFWKKIIKVKSRS